MQSMFQRPLGVIFVHVWFKLVLIKIYNKFKCELIIKSIFLTFYIQIVNE